MEVNSKLDALFEGNAGREHLDIQRYQFLEEFAKVVIKIVCVYGLFVGLNWLGEFLARHQVIIKGGFNSDVLFSVFVLPLLYSLKDIKNSLESISVTVWKNDTSITVKRGGWRCSYDRLYFKDLNNIEFSRSIGGRIGKYCTLKLYAVGGVTIVPYLKDTDKNCQAVTQLMEIAADNQQSPCKAGARSSGAAGRQTLGDDRIK